MVNMHGMKIVKIIIEDSLLLDVIVLIAIIMVMMLLKLMEVIANMLL